jgi:hypothetical protein
VFILFPPIESKHAHTDEQRQQEMNDLALCNDHTNKEKFVLGTSSMKTIEAKKRWDEA